MPAAMQVDALVLAVATAAAAGLVGCFAVMRRMALASDAISHVALPGIGLAMLFGVHPLLGALVALAGGAILIWTLEEQTRIPTDTIIGVVFSAALAIGSMMTPPEELMAAQRLVRRLPVGESVVEAILALVRSARPGPEAGETGELISWGPSPRASQALMLAVRARALLDRRLAPSIDDVVALAEPVLKHRMALTFAARAERVTIEAVIGRLKARIG